MCFKPLWPREKVQKHSLTGDDWPFFKHIVMHITVVYMPGLVSENKETSSY